MCTVSFVPIKNGVLIGSNRDERKERREAIPPAVYKKKGVQLLYPTDTDRSGTWIACNQHGTIAVLLNGAFDTYKPEARYKDSRGWVIPALLVQRDPLQAFRLIYLDETAPFTLILFHNRRLFETRWDGEVKTIRELDARQPHIWSSVTLYDEPVRSKRKAWFSNWLGQHPQPCMEELMDFHQTAGDNHLEHRLVMNKEDHTFTVSITGIASTDGVCTMCYHDLKTHRIYRSAINSLKDWTEARERMARFRIRLFHWEFWPFHLVYFPIYFHWAWLCMKARSFFFFNTANPTIQNGGFLMESKKLIYDLLPEESYPSTLFVEKGKWDFHQLVQELKKMSFSFPVIAKPDIGLRGIAVKKIKAYEDLLEYHQQTRVNYLVQSYIPYENEAGIFYYRMPGENKGRISGVVQKGFVQLKGDGQHTIEELLTKMPRYRLQLPVLRKENSLNLSEVLKEGEERQIVPYGNHSRGAIFIDITHKVTPALEETIDRLCSQIPGFYFGRLDIRYENWESLTKGCDYSIIELNGAGSEPAHIYDPQHSIFFAWKEIIRHLNILYRVSRANQQNMHLSYMSTKEGLNLLKENAAYIRKIS